MFKHFREFLHFQSYKDRSSCRVPPTYFWKVFCSNCFRNYFRDYCRNSSKVSFGNYSRILSEILSVIPSDTSISFFKSFSNDYLGKHSMDCFRKSLKNPPGISSDFFSRFFFSILPGFFFLNPSSGFFRSFSVTTAGTHTGILPESPPEIVVVFFSNGFLFV